MSIYTEMHFDIGIGGRFRGVNIIMALKIVDQGASVKKAFPTIL